MFCRTRFNTRYAYKSIHKSCASSSKTKTQLCKFLQSSSNTKSRPSNLACDLNFLPFDLLDITDICIMQPVGVAKQKTRRQVNLWAIRAQPRRFGISFVVPDRVVTEISSKRRVRGKHPLRLIRMPPGGPVEFHKIVEEANQQSPPLKNWGKDTCPLPDKAYHRSCFNDWYTLLFYHP